MLMKEHAADLLLMIELSNCLLLYTLKFEHLTPLVLIHATTHPTIGKSSSSQMQWLTMTTDSTSNMCFPTD
jgi:hypothetical protein